MGRFSPTSLLRPEWAKRFKNTSKRQACQAEPQVLRITGPDQGTPAEKEVIWTLPPTYPFDGEETMENSGFVASAKF
jgi:hypothetical protein